MTNLSEERQFLTSMKAKIAEEQKLSDEELKEICNYLEDAIELASVSIKMIDRLRINFLNLQNSLAKN
ncbi:hypothetical protein [Marinoscillum sp. MHG1-6]|uniref:hypothetical protein n=1 Tax=Marinoscillum sp. MHG1-6 TaxID=2959627 RepID=UPI0021572DB4|nr:hypothetical protein [Marinoscillum sp. MHG1-6]